MNVQEYLQNKLETCARYEMSDLDKDAIEKYGLEKYIYGKLTSKKFRKWAIDESSELQAKRAIQLNVADNKPLQFRFPFGGYKLWRLPGSPEVDWAEFFSVSYYCQYIAPILAAYQPGVEFLFASDDMIIERMDNIPKMETDSYFNSFETLLKSFQVYFPSNLKMDICRIADQYPDKSEMENELTKNIEKVKEEFHNREENKRKAMLTTSELNIRWKGAKDLTVLSSAEKTAIIEMGPVYHDAYCALEKRRIFNRGEDKIVIFTTTIPNAIAIGTTKASVTKFWTGFGVLQGGATYRDRILSPHQLLELAKDYKEELISLIPLSNFNNIRIYQAEMKFGG